MSPHWINTILYSSPFWKSLYSLRTTFLLAQLGGNLGGWIWLVAVSELKTMSRAYRQPGNLQPNRRAMWRGLHGLLQCVFLPVCQFKDRYWISQVYLPAVCSSRGPPSFATRTVENQRQNNCMAALQCLHCNSPVSCLCFSFFSFDPDFGCLHSCS